jgi:hypothetical protein
LSKTQDDLPTKTAALKRWQAIREGLIKGGESSAVVPQEDPTFQRFLNGEFIPVRSGGWNKSTREKLSYYFNLMCAEFGTSTLTDINNRTLQSFLNRIAARLCHDTVSGCYIYLKVSVSEATEQKIIGENPTKNLATPMNGRHTQCPSKMCSGSKTPWRGETKSSSSS